MEQDVNESNDQKNRAIYVAHEVLNKFANDMFADVIEFTMYVGASVVIVCIYGMFRFANIVLLECIMIIISIGSSYVLKQGLTLGVSCHIISKLYSERGLYQIKASKETRKFWKSRRPISIHVGSHFILNSNEYILNFFGKIILETAITLLLTI